VTLALGAAAAPRPALPRPISTTAVYLPPGRLYVSSADERVTTILGSCVAVCLWDSLARVGGINHFLLPHGVPGSPRFGDDAIPRLAESLIDLGAALSRLQAKVFGGASVLEAFRADENPLGARNVETAHEQLRLLGIPVVSEDVAGHSGRKLVFDVRTGSAWVRAIEPRPATQGSGGER